MLYYFRKIVEKFSLILYFWIKNQKHDNLHFLIKISYEVKYGLKLILLEEWMKYIFFECFKIVFSTSFTKKQNI